MIFRRDNPCARVVVPDYQRVRRVKLRRIIAGAGLTADQFIQLLRP
jgi:hypothetical protein